MKVLVFGAGVLGSLYAAKLHQAGHDVTLLARGERFAAVRAHGVQLEHALNGRRETIHVPLVETLAADTDYDLVLVLVRADQVDEAARVLAPHQRIKTLLFMGNNPGGYAVLADRVGPARVLLGFPGAGGYRQGDVVKYVVLPRLVQPTTVGEPDGRPSPRLTQVRHMLRSAGFPVAVNRTMDAWYQYHAAWVTPVAYAIYQTDAATGNLVSDPQLITEMMGAIRELWQALVRLGYPITPANLRLVRAAPDRLLVPIVARAASGRFADAVAYRHARTAPVEMGLMAQHLTQMADRAGATAPTWRRFHQAGEEGRKALLRREPGANS